ncbi:pyridoxal phosphate enzyme, YggS family [Corynebacterium mustelae]|uniref:Pyridoxal phosphate homeostasis protein n=2 Tax=Corynebacterium mustelae TaxID=571915 RepID=A0A0G3GZW1_9CORY|nr:pyridoxal phosphate enzyme, YggS family [Corynebacterium mustelae]
MPSTVAEFRANFSAVSSTVAEAASAAERNPEEIRIIAVSKTFPVTQALLAAEAGIKTLGENRPQELTEKAAEFNQRGITDVTWCAIGHLQRNKAKDIAQWADEFHALDSVRLAQALDSRLATLGRTLDVFIQVNTSGEEQKGGLAPTDVEKFLTDIVPLNHLKVRGLMTMARFSSEETVVRPSFAALRNLRDTLSPNLPEGMSLAELSMGMSGDFHWAIAEGATSVRIGTAIFGHRPHSPYQN